MNEYEYIYILLNMIYRKKYASTVKCIIIHSSFCRGLLHDIKDWCVPTLDHASTLLLTKRTTCLESSYQSLLNELC